MDTNLVGLLWTILFNRLFGPVTPITNELMDIPYPMAAECPDIDSLIDHQIDLLIKQCFTSTQHPPTHTFGQVVVLFSHQDQLKTKKKTGWFGNVKEQASEDMVVWEKWTININCLPITGDRGNLPEGDGVMNNAERLLQLSAASFESNLLRILEIVDKHKSHVPPIVTLEVAPFPYTIAVTPSAKPPSEDETWGHLIKKMMD